MYNEQDHSGQRDKSTNYSENSTNIDTTIFEQEEEKMGKIKGYSEQIWFAGFQKYTEGQIQIMSNYPTSELGLSTGARNVLARNNCFTLGETAALIQNNQKKSKGIGAKTTGKIVGALDKWIRDNPEKNLCGDENSLNLSEEQRKALQNVSDMLKPVAEISSDQLAGIIREDRNGLTIDRFLELSPDQKISEVFMHPRMRENLEHFWKRKTQQGITRICDFESALSQLSLEFDAQVLIRCSVEAGIIREIGEYYLMKRHTLSEYLNCGVFDNRTVQILKLRFNGAKLQEIGDRFGVSRERIRQIIAEQVKRFPQLFEDYFAEPLQKYSFTEDEFSCLFPEVSKAGFGYLLVRYKKQMKGERIPFSEACPDGYSGFWNERISGFLREKSEIVGNGVNTQKDVILGILRDNADSPVSMGSFITEYEGKIREIAQFGHGHDLGVKKLKANARGTLNNFLRTSKGVVVNRKNEVRLCKADSKTIWETVDFCRYRNRVISAKLIFRDYPELMEEQQIRDEHELYYILKSSSDLWNGKVPIHFRRVPVIKIGETSEVGQAV